jgi:nicotinic acid mononucleotide adenylyltransferase
MQKPNVWLVDDLKWNRDKFKQAHSKHFRVTLFKSATAVLERLSAKSQSQRRKFFSYTVATLRLFEK